MKWCLLIDPNNETLDAAAAVIAGALAARRPAARGAAVLGVRVERARNLEEAREVVQKNDIRHCALIVLRTRLPIGPADRAFSAGIEAAMKFIKEQKRGNNPLPVIAYSETPGPAFSGFLQAFDNTALIRCDFQWRSALAEMAGAFFDSKAVHLRNTLELDIHLDGNARWAINCKGSHTYEDNGPLNIHASSIRMLARSSTDLGNSVEDLTDETQWQKWKQRMSAIGSDLNAVIFTDSRPNGDFPAKFQVSRTMVGGDQCVRMRFTVDERSHPVLIEAIKEESDDKEADDLKEEKNHWMLKAPVFRRYHHGASAFPLFKDRESRDGSINCLIIVADPRAGAIVTEGKAFKALPGIDKEAASIGRILEKAGNQVRCLDVSQEPGDPVQAVAKALQEKRWHLVHFTGHGTFSSQNGPGLVLLAERGGIMRISELTKAIAGKTQLLFINSCNSADGGTILRAAEDQIPAVLGYRWAIKVDSAAKFAVDFYEALFTKDEDSDSYQYLEYAFLRARRELRRSNPKDPGWVAPALVMQLAQVQTGRQAPALA